MANRGRVRKEMIYPNHRIDLEYNAVAVKLKKLLLNNLVKVVEQSIGSLNNLRIGFV